MLQCGMNHICHRSIPIYKVVNYHSASGNDIDNTFKPQNFDIEAPVDDAANEKSDPNVAILVLITKIHQCENHG